ncbi:hypothetical protein [Bradyrhizobium sp. URHD0069]|uniref:hypothetical protein n=1 Tax=Bradyrhizobium sp. URHD0069 TaxID=1380355 RepID=UPI0012DD6D02|nr:hypothetical protein [Bradyrhizobium sp. URHD0069]
MTKPGQDVNGIARTEADHHVKCPACGQWFDMRDLGQVAEHIHDDREIEVSEAPGPPPRDGSVQ